MPADSSNLVVSPHFLESGSIYVYKRDFDAYFCSVGRVYVKKDTICQCINESGTLFFFGSKNTLPWELFRCSSQIPVNIWMTLPGCICK